VYPAQYDPFDLNILPTAPTLLLRRKVAKICGADSRALRIWTCRGDREMVLEIDDEGREVGWWFQDGDDIVVDTG
jgi:hypothetical protein